MFLRAALWLAGLLAVSSQDVVGSRGCTSSTCVFSNSYLRFGSGTETSVNSWGLFQQPWYYSGTSNAWYKLTFSNYPLDTAVGTGSGSTHWSGTTIVNLYGLTPTYSINDYSGFIVDSSDATKTVGHGSITSSRMFSLSGQNILFQNTFSLGKNDSFVKIVNVIINNSTDPVQNAYIWVGTRDDFVGNTDVNTKTRGNLIAGNFVPVTSNSQSSYAIMITNTNEGVLFYSETPGVMTAYALCCSFSNAYNVNPLTLAPMTPSPTDGSYAAVLPLGTVAVNSSASITWYYAAGVISSLGSVAQTVAAAQVADAGLPPVPTEAPSFTSVPIPTSYSMPTRITTFTAYPVATATATATASGSATATATATATASATASASATGSATATATASASATGSATATATASGSATGSASATATGSGSATGSSTATSTTSATASASATGSGSGSSTATSTGSGFGSSTASVSVSATSSLTETAIGSSSATGASTLTSTSTLTATPTPTTTTTATPTGTGTSSTTPSSTQTPSITATPSTTPTVHIFFLAASPQPMLISQTNIYHPPDYTPFIYFVIPITLAVFSCCIFCCFAACYYKKYLSTGERKTQETQTETDTEPEADIKLHTEAQTESVETDIVQIRTVEEPKPVKHAF